MGILYLHLPELSLTALYLVMGFRSLEETLPSVVWVRVFRGENMLRVVVASGCSLSLRAPRPPDAGPSLLSSCCCCCGGRGVADFPNRSRFSTAVSVQALMEAVAQQPVSIAIEADEVSELVD